MFVDKVYIWGRKDKVMENIKNKEDNNWIIKQKKIIFFLWREKFIRIMKRKLIISKINQSKNKSLIKRLMKERINIKTMIEQFII